MPKEEQERAILMIFPLSAFPASNYLQLRGFPDLMLLTVAWREKRYCGAGFVASLI